MKKRVFSLGAVSLIFLMALTWVYAQEAIQTDSRDKDMTAIAPETGKPPVQEKDRNSTRASGETGADKEKEKFLPEKLSVTQHSVTIGGKVLNYTATAGYMPLRNESGKLTANIFFVAYTQDRTEDNSTRPITFAFNGGPGASSIWLHLGALGPKRLPVNENNPSPPPYKPVDNEYSWLPFTDLVFIDPVGTGYSRAAPGEDLKQFYEIEGDAKSVGEFIRLYVTKNMRWLSPKFLAGESYGTFRAVELTKYLYDSCGMTFNGLMLISTALNFQDFTFPPGNDLPYLLFLPSFTATALYHGKLLPEFQGNLEKTLREAEQWALNQYGPALAKGNALSTDERNRIVEGLMRYTGLSQTYIENHNLRITNSEFMGELLRDKNLTLDLLDGRFTRTGPSPGFAYYPTMIGTIAPYMSVWNEYIRKELKYENELTYEYLSSTVNRSWDWGSAIHGYVNATDKLQEMITSTRYMKVLIAVGYYDLNTPFFSAVYAVNHLDLDPDLRNNIKITCYESGHQMYIHPPSLKKLTEHISKFIESSMM